MTAEERKLVGAAAVALALAVPSSPLAHFGRLHWTMYNGHEGRAVGADWIDDFIPDGASGTFDPFAVKIHVYRPRHRIFTRMTIAQQGHTYTVTASGPNSWL